jgi:hypothetical protein
MFWIYIEEKNVTRGKIWQALERTITVAHNNKFFSEICGAEIVPCFLRPPSPQPERVLRLGFSTEYIDALLALKEAALNPGDIIPGGARCYWYLKHL